MVKFMKSGRLLNILICISYPCSMLYVCIISVLWRYLVIFYFVNVHEQQAFRRDEELQFYRLPKRRRERFEQVSLFYTSFWCQ